MDFKNNLEFSNWIENTGNKIGPNKFTPSHLEQQWTDVWNWTGKKFKGYQDWGHSTGIGETVISNPDWIVENHFKTVDGKTWVSNIKLDTIYLCQDSDNKFFYLYFPDFFWVKNASWFSYISMITGGDSIVGRRVKWEFFDWPTNIWEYVPSDIQDIVTFNYPKLL